jgi:hypothetical protein
LKIDNLWGAISQVYGEETSNRSPQADLGIPSTGINNEGGRKRPSNDGQISGDGGDGTEENEGPRGKRRHISEPDKMLACPYSKFDPNRYSERNGRETHYRWCSSILLWDLSR